MRKLVDEEELAIESVYLEPDISFLIVPVESEEAGILLMCYASIVCAFGYREELLPVQLPPGKATACPLENLAASTHDPAAGRRGKCD